MKNPSNITEAMDQLEQVTHYYLERLYPNGKVPEIKRTGEVGENESDSDLALEIEGWVIITPFHTVEERDTIGGKTHHEAIHYQMARVKVYPGRHGGPPDSWEPDDVDILPIPELKPTTPLQAVECACRLLYENELDAIGESWQENEWSKDEEKYAQEMQ